jgi:PAS domain S-box-containing protein
MSEDMRLLIVEDVPTDAELMVRELRRAGMSFTSRLVQTRQDFVDELTSSPPDLILVDYTLPGFDGLTALDLAGKSLPHVPVIFVSGTIGEERAIETVKRGATDYVLKDRLSRLAPSVQRALDEMREHAERVRAEESLAASEARYRAIVEDQVELVCRALPDGTITFVNDSFCGYFGQSRGEVVGQQLLAFIHREDRLDIQRIVAQLDVAHPVAVGESRAWPGDGDTRWIFWTVRLIADEQGQAVEFQTVGTDITERKKMEAELVRHREHLEQLVQERTKELQTANKRLREEVAQRIRVQTEREKLITELQDAMANIKTLKGLIPICASCKKVRNDEGFWQQVEVYVRDRTEADFSHGLCPDCAKKFYPDYYEAEE